MVGMMCHSPHFRNPWQMMFNISGHLKALWDDVLSPVFSDGSWGKPQQVRLENIPSIGQLTRGTRGGTGTEGAGGSEGGGRAEGRGSEEALERLSFTNLRPAVPYIAGIDETDVCSRWFVGPGMCTTLTLHTHITTDPRDYGVRWTVHHRW